MNTVVRRLPSADWIALGIGFIGLAVGRFFPPVMGLLALAVFGPPLLREAGLLKDADEFTQKVVYRASFHTLLVMALLLFLDRIFSPWVGVPESLTLTTAFQGFSLEFLRRIMVMVFLLSYLIQYWGPAHGVSRILLGFAVLTGLEMVNYTSYWNAEIPAVYKLVPVGLTVAIFVLAWSARRFPRTTGLILLVFLALHAVASYSMMESDLVVEGYIQWSLLALYLQTSMVLAITGISLVRSGNIYD